MKQSQIINKAKLFMVNESKTELAEPLDARDDKYYFYEISN